MGETEIKTNTKVQKTKKKENLLEFRHG